MRRAGFFAVALAIAAWIAACGVSSTSVSLVMTSNLACAELRGVMVTVATVGAPGERSIQTTRCSDGAPEAKIGTLDIVPGKSKDATVAVRIVAGVDRPVAECSAESGYQGCIVARRTMRFVPGRDVEVHVSLRRDCVAVACNESATCVGGQCRSATCVDSTCDEGSLPPLDTPPDGGPPAVEFDAGPPDAAEPPDTGVVTPLPDGGPVCPSTEKLCAGKCVSADFPEFGCSPTGCSPCPDISISDYTCANQKCTLAKCKPGYKKCGGGCVAAVATNGCGAATCTPCEANNGTASCKSDGTCDLKCSTGFKLCGGKCVSVTDPTYGCGLSGCGNNTCPNPGSGGTLACIGTNCVIASCPAGTKKCNQNCVPKDVQNGCDDPAKCSACPTGNICSGTPQVCTCVPEPLQTTCAGKSCGEATNNCGQKVQCPDRCTWPETCGGGGAGNNRCGCTSAEACPGMNCGAYYDNCGRYTSCGGCSWPDFCGGGGNNVCGAPPDGNCGPNWPSMGSFSCDAGRQVQTICGCYPPMYFDPAYWAREGGDCYRHFTGAPC